ncbi:MAG: radical SAM protein [Candidatus Margulisbacteria bacterium]|jgi:sulfatase maturation enzyme AslB (radical SAM superfamily)|nr:radical SAM protein [Candidatus Margulisiibacteriota bacterium]
MSKKNLVFKQNETEESILKQLKQNKLFSPLVKFLHKTDLARLAEKPKTLELSVAELKNMLAYDEILDQYLADSQEVNLLAELFQDSESLTSKMPCLIKVTKKNMEKLLRLNKYYFGSAFLFRKFPGGQALKNAEFFLPFLQTPILLALLKALPDKQKITVGLKENLDLLIDVKAMLALREKIKEKPAIQPSSATLIMSEECNLRCTYCYEPHKVRDKTVLTFEQAKRVLRKFDRDSKITFFGGEPMLQIELMKKICEWGWEYRNFNFELITNGQIIDRGFFRDYAKYFDYIQLSCDGPEPAQDINRGHGSFHRAMEFYRVFYEETGRHPTLHPVLSKYSVPYMLDTIKWFYEMEKSHGSIASLRWLPGDANIWDETDFQVYAEQLNLVKSWYLANDIRKTSFSIRAFAQAEKDLLGLENRERHPLRGDDTFCSAGRGLMAVLPNGKVVPCHHEYWCAPEERVYEEIDLDADFPGIDHMSELCMKDIPECNSCPQWGCCVCPGSFYFHSKSYTTPDKNWCRAGKLLIETAKSYAEELAQRLHDEQHKVDYLAAGVDYLLQKETNSKIDLSKPR